MNKETQKRPLRVINSLAPIRICDNGGWTDTWFAGQGKIFNMAVYPGAEVQIEIYPSDGDEERVVIWAENYGQPYIRYLGTAWQQHPLLEAAIERVGLPDDVVVRVTVFCSVPAGAATGTSAAVAVALVGALDRLTPGRLTAHEVAYIAQSIETDMLKQQCGIQDQLAAAYGGINYMEMFRYPTASVSPILVPEAVWWELEQRLVLIYLGKPHHSSQIHEEVIHRLEEAGPTAKQLDALRKTAEPSRDALYAGDFTALGWAMRQNTAAQRNLHPGLVTAEAERVIEIAKAHGAAGWKVNGAGGAGGSLTILAGPLAAARRAMIREIEAENQLCQHIPIHLSRYGLRVWQRSELSAP
jgi:D-glycero-alpha-D-manno-heptose-7-phosphate kinase